MPAFCGGAFCGGGPAYQQAAAEDGLAALALLVERGDATRVAPADAVRRAVRGEPLRAGGGYDVVGILVLGDRLPRRLEPRVVGLVQPAPELGVGL